MKAFTQNMPRRLERHARMLEASGDYCILRRLPKPEEMWCRSMPTPASVTRIAVVDTETTGLDPTRHHIIELAMVTMDICDARGDLVDIRPPVSFLEQPPAPLSDEIMGLTGLTDAELTDCHFDEHVIADAFERVDLIVAHNARFDLTFVRQRFPDLTLPWACSASEIDWRSHGFAGGRSVGALLTAAGLFAAEAHRAGPDAWATAVLLSTIAADGRCLAAHLVEQARKVTYRLYAANSPFSCKSTLKATGYRWCGKRRAWWLEAEPELLANESAWLTSLHPAIRPDIVEIDWFDRHAA